MRKLKSLWLVSVVLLLVSCSMSAKSDKSSEAGTASKGEVVIFEQGRVPAKGNSITRRTALEMGNMKGDKPCIIDFYADWCGPCKQVAPILRDLAILYKNDIVVYKVNVDKEKELAAAFGIQSIPTFLFIPKEGQPQISMGALPREEFVKQIDTFLLKKK